MKLKWHIKKKKYIFYLHVLLKIKKYNDEYVKIQIDIKSKFKFN